MLWEKEPVLVKSLQDRSIIYTRYIDVDDITVSSKLCDTRIKKADITLIVKLIYTMLFSIGVKPNRRKHKIMSGKGNMQVHKLNVNSGKPTYEKKKKELLKLEMFNLQKHSEKHGRNSKEYLIKHRSLTGKIKMQLLHYELTA